MTPWLRQGRGEILLDGNRWCFEYDGETRTVLVSVSYGYADVNDATIRRPRMHQKYLQHMQSVKTADDNIKRANDQHNAFVRGKEAAGTKVPEPVVSTHNALIAKFEKGKAEAQALADAAKAEIDALPTVMKSERWKIDVKPGSMFVDVGPAKRLK